MVLMVLKILNNKILIVNEIEFYQQTMTENHKPLMWNMKPIKPLDAANFSSISSNSSTHNMNINGSDFSFHKGIDSHSYRFTNKKQAYYFEEAPQTLRTDLGKLAKQELIDLLMDEIEENKNNRMREHKKLQSVQENSNENWMFKYQQLAMYMEQYIGNTNQANKQFIQIIKNLKLENQSLFQEKASLQMKQNCKQCDILRNNISLKQKDYEQTIQGLEQSLEHYMQINNNISIQFQKLKIQYDKLTHELQSIQQKAKTFEDQHKSNFIYTNSQFNSSCSKTLNSEITFPKDISKRNCNTSPCKDKQNWKVSSQNDLRQFQEKVKLLRIQNNELRDCNEKMQGQLELKSEKIRKLLQDIEKLSEQKWRYKEYYLEHKQFPEKI